MKNIKSTLFLIGYAVMLIGVACRVFSVNYCQYIVVAGTAIATIFRLLTLPKSDDRRIRHLNVQQLFVAALQCLGAYMVWKGAYTAWVLPFLISAVADLVLSYAYDRGKLKK